MQDDIDPVSGQPIPVVGEAEQRFLAELMVRHLLAPPRTDFARQVILERQCLDFEEPWDLPPDPPVPAFTLEELEGVEP